MSLQINRGIPYLLFLILLNSDSRFFGNRDRFNFFSSSDTNSLCLSACGGSASGGCGFFPGQNNVLSLRQICISLRLGASAVFPIRAVLEPPSNTRLRRTYGTRAPTQKFSSCLCGNFPPHLSLGFGHWDFVSLCVSAPLRFSPQPSPSPYPS